VDDNKSAKYSESRYLPFQFELYSMLQQMKYRTAGISTYYSLQKNEAYLREFNYIEIGCLPRIALENIAYPFGENAIAGPGE